MFRLVLWNCIVQLCHIILWNVLERPPSTHSTSLETFPHHASHFTNCNNRHTCKSLYMRKYTCSNGVSDFTNHESAASNPGTSMDFQFYSYSETSDPSPQLKKPYTGKDSYFRIVPFPSPAWDAHSSLSTSTTVFPYKAHAFTIVHHAPFYVCS